MRKYGVYMPELHTMLLSAAHSQEDIVKVSSAFDSSLDDMIRDKFFVL
jgi:glutamate-1-semialdehyde 2,1-aminomutase